MTSSRTSALESNDHTGAGNTSEIRLLYTGRLKVAGYTLTDHVPGEHHGLATFGFGVVMFTSLESLENNNLK